MADFSQYGGDAEENVEIKKLAAEVVGTPHIICNAAHMQEPSLIESL